MRAASTCGRTCSSCSNTAWSSGHAHWLTPRAGRKDYFCGRGLAGGTRAVSCPFGQQQGRDTLHSRLVVEGRRRDVLALMCLHLGGLRAGRLHISPPGPATRAAREGGRHGLMKLCASRARGRTLQPLVVDSRRAPCHRCPIHQQMACAQCGLPWGEVAPYCARGHAGHLAVMAGAASSSRVPRGWWLAPP